MGKDLQDVLMVLRFVAEGVGVASEVSDLARRVLRGERVTDEEISAARLQVRQSVAQFDQVVSDRKSASGGS